MQDVWVVLGLIMGLILLYLLFRTIWMESRIRRFVPGNHSKEQLDEFNNMLEAAGFAYNEKQNMFYSRQDAWQREFGYRTLYDEMAPTFYMVFDCEPIRFEYDGKEWMIELWKGQYGVNTGAEVGVYVKEDDNHYRAANKDEELYIRYHLWRGRKIIDFREQRGWWITCFLLGNYSKPEALALSLELVFPTKAMANAFLQSAAKLGYNRRNISNWENAVQLYFKKPYSKQPKSKKGIMARFVMMMNRINCKLFCSLTKKQPETIDKITYFKLRAPLLYRFMEKALYAWRQLYVGK
ncbi:MAG: hypothetical protein PWP24_952 [Clostridiales bacterium]|nr:hypothetical protein [Clostridiales bacterium]